MRTYWRSSATAAPRLTSQPRCQPGDIHFPRVTSRPWCLTFERSPIRRIRQPAWSTRKIGRKSNIDEIDQVHGDAAVFPGALLLASGSSCDADGDLRPQVAAPSTAVHQSADGHWEASRDAPVSL